MTELTAVSSPRPSLAVLPRLAQAAIPLPVLSLIARVSIAAVFFLSGRTKVEGLLTVTEAAHHGAQGVPEDRLALVGHDGWPKNVDGFGALIEVAKGAGQIVGRFHAVGAGQPVVREELRRQFRHVHAIGQSPQVSRDGAVVRQQLQRRFVGAHRRDKVAVLFAGDGQHVPGDALSLILFQHFQRQRIGLLEVTGLDGRNRLTQQTGCFAVLELVGGALEPCEGLERGRITHGRSSDSSLDDRRRSDLLLGQRAAGTLEGAFAGH